MDYLRIALALFAVLAMIGAFAWVARKAGLAGAGGVPIRKKRRIAVVEQLFLDPRRRAVILACDGREHLVILGPTGETIVEHHLPGSKDVVEPEPQTTPSFVAAWRKIARRDHDVAVSDAA